MKGLAPIGAGAFYCPYIPLQMVMLKVERGYNPMLKRKHIIKVTGATSNQFEEISQWVSVTFGEKKTGFYNPRWLYSGCGVWNFQYPADATFFILRWA